MSLRPVNYDLVNNVIKVNADKITQPLYGLFATAIDFFLDGNQKEVTIDLSSISNAYADGVVPIICDVDYLRSKEIDVNVLLPNDHQIRRIFRSMNWAHYLSPSQYPTSEFYDTKHMPLSAFKSSNDQYELVNKFMNVILDETEYTEDLYALLEWSVNEITDNVLQHAESDENAYFQATVFSDQINFVVCDTGLGVLNTMKKAFSNLNTDEQAILEAIKPGVTSKTKGHQGNGLAGTLNVVTETGGNYLIKSGRGKLYVNTSGESRSETRPPKHNFRGTLVSASIGTNNLEKVDAEKILTFGSRKSSVPSSVIETLYEKEDEDATIIRIKDTNLGFGTRIAGEKLRKRTINLIRLRPEYPHYIDWKGVNVISSSFADEYIGKLFLEIGLLEFSARIRNVNMNDLIRGLIDRAAAQRLTQEKDL